MSKRWTTRNILRSVRVTPLPNKNRPIVYRATYKKCVSYGRTPQSAVENVSRKYRRTRLTPTNVLDQVVSSIFF